MARFYFHFLEGTSLAADDEGIELSGPVGSRS
jgi:hypothetical protein